MSDRIHRVVIFVAAILAGVLTFGAIGDVMSKEIIGWLGFTSFVLTLAGNSWRILFPDDKPAS